MKIEIGESLVLSWLKHVKKCQIVQLNWKPSSEWETSGQLENGTLMKNIEEHFSSQHNLSEIFKKSSCEQLLQQGEIDALGLSFINGIFQNITAVDIAFHENGLNYGSSDETVTRIIKKMTRTAMVTHNSFGVKKGDIVFASPKIHHATLSRLEAVFIDLNKILRMDGIDFDFHLICNEQFDDLILSPVLSLSEDVADTSELFLRSYQLLQLFNDRIKNNPTETIKDYLPREKRERMDRSSTEIENKVAYYLARFDHESLFPRLNQNKSFEKISQILNVKPNTIKNKRDYFDSFVNELKTSGKKREGWKTPLSDEMQKVFDYFLHKTPQEIENEIKELLGL